MRFQRAVLFPVRYSFIFALVYGVFSFAWIRYSTNLVRTLSSSVEEVSRLELYKGYGFILATGILLFCFSLAVFRKMAKSASNLIESQQRLVQAERDAISGLLASSVAHDISNLVTILHLNVERLTRIPDLEAPAKDSVIRMERAIIRMNELTNRMRNAGRNALKEKPREFNLRETLEETLCLIANHRSVKACAIQLNGANEIKAVGYPILVHQLLINLILNAAEATCGHGRILVEAKRVGDSVSLSVADDGPGIAPDAREKVFEAFYTTKSTGTGLGLMSVKSCVEMYGGTVSVRDSDLGGAEFSVVLPDLIEQGSMSHKQQDKMLESLNKTRATSPGISL